MSGILKYPRTEHVQGSKLQPGDEDLRQVSWSSLNEKFLVFEEKMDGANTAVSFTSDGEMKLQCRGHYLRGGSGEAQFALFKTWAATFEDRLFDMLEDRFVMYGEWMYAKHTIFYDDLPHYFMEFDVYDKKNEVFLSTTARDHLLDRTLICPVEVIAGGNVTFLESCEKWVVFSNFKTVHWRKNLEEAAKGAGLDPKRVAEQTDPSDRMEGLYIKWESFSPLDEEGRITKVEGRYKWVRHDFVNHILDSDEHWKDRPIVPNQLKNGLESLFLPSQTFSTISPWNPK